jgi:hypothetical protein
MMLQPVGGCLSATSRRWVKRRFDGHDCVTTARPQPAESLGWFDLDGGSTPI